MEIKLNEEQQLAFDNIVEFINTGDHKNEYYTLQGLAGTGKTEILARLPNAFPNRRFIVCAISHKAKENIAQRVKARNVKPMTIAALLAMKLDVETGEFKEDEWAQDIPIGDADIAIVDEGSMIDKFAIKYMYKKKLYRTVLIFAGDIGQVRPIQDSNELNNFSPIFSNKNISWIKNRVRQGEGNPILAHMDYYWNMTQNPSPKFEENLQKDNEENHLGRIIYTNDMKNVIKTYLPHFKRAVEEKNTNIIKIITYRNTIRQKINDLVRRALYGEGVAEYEIGDLMIMTDTYQVDRYTKYENSLEFCVTSFRKDVKQIGEYHFDYFDLRGITGNDSTISVPVLAEKDKEKFKRFIDKLFNEAKEKQGLARRNAFADARAVQNIFAKCDSGYCLTVHKSQGSTYDISIVNLTDMLKAPINIQEQASLIYTGGTRARKEVVMVCKSFKNTL